MSATPADVYFFKEGEIYGPHPLEGIGELLDAGWLSPEHHYWREGLKGWTPISELIAQTASDVVGVPAETEASALTPPAGTVPSEPPRAIAYRSPDSFSIGYSLSGAIALHLLFFLVLSRSLGYGEEIHKVFLPNAPQDPPMEVSLVTETQPAPPPTPEVEETPPPPPEPPPPDIPPPPPPAPAEMPVPSVPVVAPTPLPVPQVAEQPQQPIQPAPPVKKVSKAPRPAPPVPAVSQEIVQANPTDYLDAPRPEYPYAAQLKRQQGTVELLVSLDSEGRPGRVSIYRSSGWAILDDSARAQVLRHWLFKPGNSANVLVPIEFSMAH